MVTLTSDVGTVDGFTINITGTAIQNLLPFGMNSIFQDDVSAGVWAAATMNALDDSLFLFNSGDVVTPGTETESATQLFGDISVKGGTGLMSVDVARVVVPAGTAFNVAGTAAIDNGDLAETFSAEVPEPASISLLAFGSLVIFARRRVARG